MVKNVFYGEVATSVGSYVDINKVQIALLTVLTLLIFIFGVYPTPFFSMISETVGLILNKFVSI
jgi:NADH:ubiquinone oxidoreductase subunit 4 (subunit M)